MAAPRWWTWPESAANSASRDRPDVTPVEPGPAGVPIPRRRLRAACADRSAARPRDAPAGRPLRKASVRLAGAPSTSRGRITMPPEQHDASRPANAGDQIRRFREERGYARVHPVPRRAAWPRIKERWRYIYTAITSRAIDRTEPCHVARTGAVGEDLRPGFGASRSLPRLGRSSERLSLRAFSRVDCGWLRRSIGNRVSHLWANRWRAACLDTPSATAIRFQLRPRARTAATRSVTRALSRRTCSAASATARRSEGLPAPRWPGQGCPLDARTGARRLLSQRLCAS